MSVARSLIKGAEEALAIAKGELEPGAMFVPETVDVASPRSEKGRSCPKRNSRDSTGCHMEH